MNMTKIIMITSIVTLLLLAAQAEVFSGDEITMLDNGAIVHTKYIVDSADHLVHLHLEDKIEALSCGEDHVLINTTGRIHDFDTVWQNGSILYVFLFFSCPCHLAFLFGLPIQAMAYYYY
jgi:urea transporter